MLFAVISRLPPHFLARKLASFDCHALRLFRESGRVRRSATRICCQRLNANLNVAGGVAVVAGLNLVRRLRGNAEALKLSWNKSTAQETMSTDSFYAS